MLNFFRWKSRKEAARKAWEQARDRYLDARRRQDTRAMHEAEGPLVAAQLARLRAGA